MIVFLKWLKQSPEILADKRSTSESLAGTYLNTFFIKSIAPRWFKSEGKHDQDYSLQLALPIVLVAARKEKKDTYQNQDGSPWAITLK